MTTDYFEQIETPTIQLLKSRSDKRVESDGLFRFGHKQYPDMAKDAVVKLLQAAAQIVAETDAERFRVELLIEQVKQK